MPDNYLITTPLGAGSAGTVFLAEHRDSGQRCALKLARPGGAGADVLAAELQHSNIVTFFEADGARAVMEYIDGPSLRTVLDRGVPPLEQTLRWMAQLLDALAYLHARGLVHRDVKPANLLLAPDGTLKLADFGIARRQDGPPVQDSSGTPNYMAPEQMRGGAADPRSDLYAAGVVLYELLTGTRPHQGSAFEVMQQALKGRHRPPSALRPVLSQRYDQLVATALAPDPGRRYAGALKFNTDLQAAALPHP